jgi:hypothetical protein
MNGAYDSVVERLTAKGIRAAFHRPHQLVLPRRIWITWNGQWFVSTWTPAVYPVPAGVDVVAVCEECLAWPDDPFYEIPEAICHRYGLCRMNQADFDRVCPIPDDIDEEDPPNA